MALLSVNVERLTNDLNDEWGKMLINSRPTASAEDKAMLQGGHLCEELAAFADKSCLPLAVGEC